MTNAEILNLLEQFVKIPSISANSSHRAHIHKAVAFLQLQLEKIGFAVETFQHDDHSPLVLATYTLSEAADTLGIYGHYDVQPEDPLVEWTSPPFALARRDGKLYGRGVADDKGHIIANLAALEHLITTKQLRHNIIIVIEGEEECGDAASFESYVKEATATLAQAHAFVITDMGMHEKNVPQIFYGLRGLIYFELHVEIGMRDLHSGVYGGRVHNPLNVLTHVLSTMQDEETRQVMIPHFYDDIREISHEEIAKLTRNQRPVTSLTKESGVFALAPLDPEHPSLSSKIHPSFDVHGIWGGYAGEGEKTVIPRSAGAKFSFRLIEHQRPEMIEQLVQAHVAQHMPRGVKFTLKATGSSPAFYTDYTNPWTQKVARVLKHTFNHETVFNRSGGSVPAAEVLSRLFKKPAILTGFTLSDDNIHAPNENFDEEMFFKGIEALERIYGTKD